MKTEQAVKARKRQLDAMSAEERHAIGLRLRCIHGGLAVQRMYRRTGRNPMEAAHAVRHRKTTATPAPSRRSRTLPTA